MAYYDNEEKMIEKVDEFNDRYSEYFKGNISDEEMTEHVSQPFWHSLHLSKKRLDNNGLDMEIDIKNVSKKTKKSRNSYPRNDFETVVGLADVLTSKSKIQKVNFENGERISAGEFKQEVNVRKKIKKGNKVLFKTKDREISLTNVIKVRGDGQYAVCPRCGHDGAITSYIDGCDYCHSKFKVSDFNEKISGFSIEPDGKRKVYGICKKFFLALGISIGLLVISFFLMFLFAALSALFNIQNEIFTGTIIFFVLGYTAAEALMPAIIGIIIAILVIMIVMAAKYKNERIEKNAVLNRIERTVAGFSSNDFVQNLEYKLRNIHFAERTHNVESFTSFNMENVISKYENVIECFLHKVKFVSFKTSPDYYIMNLEVVLRLTRLNGNKAKTENEKLFLTLLRKKNIEEKNIGSIFEFTCDKCGSGIDMFKGGICDYCGEKIDYSNHDWIIESYYSNIKEKDISNVNEKVIFGNKKYVEYYKKARRQVLSVLIGSALLICTIVCVKNRDSLYAVLHMKEYMKISDKEFEALHTLEDTWYGEDLKKINKKTEDFEQIINYEYDENFEYIASEYAEKIIEEHDYTMLIETDSLVALSKKVKFDEKISAYYIVSIELEGDEIILSYGIYESKREYLEETDVDDWY